MVLTKYICASNENDIEIIFVIYFLVCEDMITPHITHIHTKTFYD